MAAGANTAFTTSTARRDWPDRTGSIRRRGRDRRPARTGFRRTARRAEGAMRQRLGAHGLSVPEVAGAARARRGAATAGGRSAWAAGAARVARRLRQLNRIFRGGDRRRRRRSGGDRGGQRRQAARQQGGFQSLGLHRGSLFNGFVQPFRMLTILMSLTVSPSAAPVNCSAVSAPPARRSRTAPSAKPSDADDDQDGEHRPDRDSEQRVQGLRLRALRGYVEALDRVVHGGEQAGAEHHAHHEEHAVEPAGSERDRGGAGAVAAERHAGADQNTAGQHRPEECSSE